MKNKQWLFILFGLMVIAQLFVPISMIFQSNIVLKNGTEFKFKLQPIDPSDPFRGEYVVLNFTDNTYVPATTEIWQNETLVYVIIENNESGYAYIADVRKKKPTETSNYLTLPINYVEENYLQFNFPFDRFYMSENKAQKAEDLYIENLRDSSSINYAIVSIKDGKSVIKDIQVNGVSLVELVGK